MVVGYILLTNYQIFYFWHKTVEKKEQLDIVEEQNRKRFYNDSFKTSLFGEDNEVRLTTFKVDFYLPQ